LECQFFFRFPQVETEFSAPLVLSFEVSHHEP